MSSAAGGAGGPPALAAPLSNASRALVALPSKNFVSAKPLKPLPLHSIENLDKMKTFISKEYFDGTKQRAYEQELDEYTRKMAEWQAAKEVREAPAKALAALSYNDYMKAKPILKSRFILDLDNNENLHSQEEMNARNAQYAAEVEKYNRAKMEWMAGGEARPRLAEEKRQYEEEQKERAERFREWASAPPPVALPARPDPADPVAFEAYLSELEKLRNNLVIERDKLKEAAATSASGVGSSVLPGGRRRTRQRKNRRSKKARKTKRNRSA